MPKNILFKIKTYYTIILLYIIMYAIEIFKSKYLNYIIMLLYNLD